HRLRLRDADVADEQADGRRDGFPGGQARLHLSIVQPHAGGRRPWRQHRRARPAVGARQADRKAGQVMSYIEALEQLEEMIRQARSVPLSASAVIPRSDALKLLEEIRA